MLAMLLVAACRAQRVEERVAEPATRATAAQPVLAPSQSAASAPSLAPPVTWMTLPESAYGKTLIADSDAAYLLTASAAYRMVEGKEPVKLALDLGIGPAATRDGIVFWSNGAVFLAPRKTGKARRLIALPHQPQQFVAAGEHFAWLDHADDGRFTIQTMKAKSPVVMHTTRLQVDAIAMVGDNVVFVERTDERQWRFASLPLAGGDVVYSAPHEGRTPAQLVAGRDIHYYDGNRFEIRRLGRDLSESVVARGSVCSPMAVASEIYCGAVEGPYRISPERPVPLPLADGDGRSVTALAATERRVFWVRDEGAEKLAVQSVPVPREPAPSP